MSPQRPGRRVRVRLWAAGAAGAALLLGLGWPAGALRAQSTTLDRVESLSSDGRTTRARDSLDAWWDAHFQDASTEEQQRALWLRGTLSVDPTEARKDYMELVLEHPGGPYSARALLRVAQERVAGGRPADAARRFEELLREYPNSPQRLDARRWLDTHRDAVSLAPMEPAAGTPSPPPGSEPDSAVVSSSAPRSEPDSAATSPPAADTGSAAADVPASLPVSIQLGAFSSTEGARTLLRAARNEGIEGLRIVRIEGSDLVRVRAGRFADAASAADLRNRILARGFEATIVEDGSRERPIQ